MALRYAAGLSSLLCLVSFANARPDISDINSGPFLASSSYNFFVQENHPRGATVGTVTSPEDAVTYTIRTGASLDGVTYFHLHPSSGELILIDNTNLHNIKQFLLVVTAADPRGHTANALVTVNVRPRTADRPLVFEPQLLSTKANGYRQAISHRLWKRSADSRGPRRNENPPVFTTGAIKATVWEYAPIGSVIAAVRAVDADGDQVQYSIVGDRVDDEYFIVDDLTGQLMLRKRLADNTVDSYYSFMVLASDTGFPSLSSKLPVKVKVRRDILPAFINPADVQTSVALDKSTTKGTVVLKTLATDDDLIGSIQYGSKGREDAALFFEMNEDNGQISLTRDLREGTSTAFTLDFYALDSALPEACSAIYSVTFNVVS